MSEEKPDTGTNLGVLVPPKRKQGRPRKDQTVRPLGEKSTVPQKTDGRGRKPRRKKGDVTWPATDSTFIGQQVRGVLDGSFDAGYLLTVRVGDSQTVLRGVVFEPSLSVPISKCNDIAPSVRLIRRDEQTLPTMHPPSAITGPALSSPVSRLPLAPPVYTTTLAATQISLKGYQQQNFLVASTRSAQVLTEAAEPESGSSKLAARPHDRNDTASPSHPDEPGPPQKVEIQSVAQLQSA